MGEKGIRKELFHSKEGKIQKPAKDEPVGSVRLNVRVSGENAKFLDEESERTGTTVSSLCSLAIADWCDERRANMRKLGQYDDMLSLMETDPKTFKEFIDYIKSKK